MYSAAGAVCIAGAAILTINAREVQYLRNQNDASASALLPIHFSTMKKKERKKVGQAERLIKPNVHNIAPC